MTNLRRETINKIYAGTLLECTPDDYPEVRKALLGLIAKEDRLDTAIQVASCELQRLDALFTQNQLKDYYE